MSLFGNDKPQQTPPLNSSPTEQIIFNSQGHQDNADFYSNQLEHTKEVIRADIIESLTGLRYQEVKDTDIKKATIRGQIQTSTSSKKKYGWMPIAPGIRPTMQLGHAMQVANFVSGQLDREFSTTYYSADVSTIRMAGIIATQAAHLLDTVKFEYDGDEGQMSAFSTLVISKVHAALNRSINGYYLRQVGTSTQVLTQTKINEGSPDNFKFKNPNSLERLFGLGGK